ncbi:hypothetical protein JYT87_03080, partial [Nitrospira defluvii]|nr:hypothetical protein [Nitrospira defluvii]
DKGRKQISAKGWNQDNLSRLLRSLYKVTRETKRSTFSDGEWQIFLEGYRSFHNMNTK